MSDDDYDRLLECLDDIKGRFLLSGYESDLYAQFAVDNDWTVCVKEIDNKASSKTTKDKKIECLWRNF